MSGSPKYSRIQMSAERLAEIEAAAAAERRRRVEQAIRRRADLMAAYEQRREAALEAGATRRARSEERRQNGRVDRRRHVVEAQDVVEAAIDLRARAFALTVDPIEDEQDPALVRADGAVERALEDDDESALRAATEAALDALERAELAREEAVLTRARRRMIAIAIVQALPDRYVVDGQLDEDPDGTVLFRAFAADEELRVTVTGDGANGEVVGYQAHGARFEERIEDGRAVSDCPDLAARLEALHARLAQGGIVPGPLQWRDAPTRRLAPTGSRRVPQTQRRTR